MGFNKAIKFATLLLDIIGNGHGPHHKKHSAKCGVTIFVDYVMATLNCHCRSN